MALDLSGGFGDAILNGLMPIAMVYIGRYYLGYSSSYKVFGGRPLLFFVFLFFLFALSWETLAHLGYTDGLFKVVPEGLVNE